MVGPYLVGSADRMLDILSRQFANLLTLRAAVETGSINKAAAYLRTSQPAVTRSITRLEAAVGCKLIERNARGVAPTEFGRLILGHVSAAALELQAAGRDLSILQRARSGGLLCGAAPVSMNFLVPAAVHQFLKGRKQTNVRLVEAPTRALLDQLRAGDLDIVVGVKLEEEDYVGLEFDPLVEEIRGIYGSAGHRLVRLQPCRMEDILRTENWVLADPLPGYVTERLADFDFSTIPTLIRTQSTSVLRWYARMTDFLVMSTSLVHSTDLLNGAVVKIETDWDMPPTQHVIYRKARSKTPKAAIDFINLMREAVRTQRLSHEGLGQLGAPQAKDPASGRAFPSY
jgi:DNA-binding transcriptional LysR family regulator